MSKFGEYLRTRKFGWWLSNVLLAMIIVLIAFPSLRIQFSAWVRRQFLPNPEIEYKSEYYYYGDEWLQFSYLDLNDERHFFGEHEGEVMFINVWGTWCGHCVAEMPSIEKLYDDYKGKVTFLVYSDKDSRSQLINFKEDGDYDLPFIYRDPQTQTEFRVNSYPTTYIISRKGEIIHHQKGAADWNADAVRKRLNELLKE